jgi:hypothetical protein
MMPAYGPRNEVIDGFNGGMAASIWSASSADIAEAGKPAMAIAAMAMVREMRDTLGVL